MSDSDPLPTSSPPEAESAPNTTMTPPEGNAVGRFFGRASRTVASFLTSTFGRHFLLVLVMVVGVVGFAFWSQNFACRKAERWLNIFNGATGADAMRLCEDSPLGSSATAPSGAGRTGAASTPTPTPSPIPSPTPTPNGASAANDAAATPTPTPTPTCKPPADEYLKRLEEQEHIIRARGDHHGEVMASFYRAYYMAINVMLLTGVVAAIALFFIAQSGWGLANSYVKTVFIVMTAAFAYYGLYPGVFEQQKNIADNKELFLEYKTLENEIASFPKTCGNLKKEANTPGDFINYIDNELDRLSNIAIGFDYTKINYKGALDPADINRQPTPTPTPTQAGG